MLNLDQFKNENLPEDEYLSVDELRTLRDVLVERMENIENQSHRAVSELTEVRRFDPDAVDFASSESSRDFLLRMSDRERRLANKIRKSLERILTGEYGECEECGEPIGFKRLLARPVTTHCIDCKTQAEKIERRR